MYGILKQLPPVFQHVFNVVFVEIFYSYLFAILYVIVLYQTRNTAESIVTDY